MNLQRQRRFDAIADRVERVLYQYKAPANVTGGHIGPRVVCFYLLPQRGVRTQAIRRVSEEIALSIGAPEVSIRRTDHGLTLEFPRDDPQTVRFPETLADAEPLPLATALLGIGEDGLPLLAKLSSPSVAHVLIAGTTGSGKSVLLRTIAASLLLPHPPERIRAICLDPKGRALQVFDGLPQLLRSPLRDGAEIADVLRSLVRLMEIRDEQREDSPRIVVLIDELADIIMTVDAVEKPLTRLSQRGREAGIHLVAATQRPSAAILSGLMRANFPLRLVGRVISADDAKVATGRHGTGAETLTGRGDFLAVTGARTIRFQAAYTEDVDLREAFADWRDEVSAPDLLPAVEEEERASDDLDALAIKLAPWWNDNGGKRGSKTKACRILFGEDTIFGGYYAQKLDQVIARIENTSSDVPVPARSDSKPDSDA